MQLPDGDFLYGRVISTTAVIVPMTGCILIYIYAARSADKNLVPELYRSQLLIPPMMTNKLPWSKGYFELIASGPLNPMDRLPQHCFARTWMSPPQYFDDKGNQLNGPISPVGEYGLQSYRTIDDHISKALGIALAPED